MIILMLIILSLIIGSLNYNLFLFSGKEIEWALQKNIKDFKIKQLWNVFRFFLEYSKSIL